MGLGRVMLMIPMVTGASAVALQPLAVLLYRSSNPKRLPMRTVLCEFPCRQTTADLYETARHYAGTIEQYDSIDRDLRPEPREWGICCRKANEARFDI